MEILFFVYLFIFGTLFGSFSSVIIDRIKNKKSGIIDGRSECPKCKHILWPLDLIPIFSYIFSKWKCKYCWKKISPLYPILEVSSGVFFSLVGYFLIDISLLLSGNIVEFLKLIFLGILSFLTIVYVFYDILYLEIPDRILFILISMTTAIISWQSFFPEYHFLNTFWEVTQISFWENIILLWLLLIIITSLYIIMLKWLKEIYDIWILVVWVWLIIWVKYGLGIDLENTILGKSLLWVLALFSFLFIQIVISGGTWMWGGDLRIAILMWLVVGIWYSFEAIMISYFTGSIFWSVLILYTKMKKHRENQKKIIVKMRKILWFQEKKITIDTKMPFWPFLAIGIFWILFFQGDINTIITKYF